MDSDDQDIFSEFRDPERRSLIRQIREKYPVLSHIPAESYAALWLSEMDLLKQFATLPKSSSLEFQLANTSDIDHVGIMAGSKQNTLNVTPRERNHDSSTVSEEDPAYLNKPAPRDPDVVDLVLNRDSEKCVLTGNPKWASDVCHIIPHKLNSNTGQLTWGWLRAYWGTEQCETWKKQILGENGNIDTEQVLNMLTFSVQIRSYWINSICAFRPISVNEDKTSMTLAFHW